jgi:hypothetical protein
MKIIIDLPDDTLEVQIKGYGCKDRNWYCTKDQMIYQRELETNSWTAQKLLNIQNNKASIAEDKT